MNLEKEIKNLHQPIKSCKLKAPAWFKRCGRFLLLENLKLESIV